MSDSNETKPGDVSTDQLIELTAHLERVRARAIVEAVEKVAAENDPATLKPFWSGWSSACEEAALRLKTEPWGMLPNGGWGPTGAANEDDRPSPEFPELLRRALSTPSIGTSGDQAPSDATYVLRLLEAAGHIVPGKLAEAQEIAARFGAPQPASPVAAAPIEALRRLESANDALCAMRTPEQYQSMIDAGQGDALIELDDARCDARTALAAPQLVERKALSVSDNGAAFPEAYLGQLATVNQDDFPGLAAWWLQIRDGSANGAIIARVYGTSPDEVYKRAQAVCACISEPSQPTVAIPANLDVRRVMLSISPGWDGMGEEIYAKSTADVEKALADLDAKNEALQERVEAALSASQAHGKSEAVAACEGCNGHGEVGGLRSDGYHSEQCPFCKGSGEAAPAAEAAVVAVPVVIHQHGFAKANQTLQTINESLDKQLEQVMAERDDYHDVADKLAAAIAEHCGVDIGEHSSDSSPWAEALDALAAAPDVAAIGEGGSKDAARYRWLRTYPNNIGAAVYAPTFDPSCGGLLRRDAYLDAAIDAALARQAAPAAEGKQS